MRFHEKGVDEKEEESSFSAIFKSENRISRGGDYDPRPIEKCIVRFPGIPAFVFLFSRQNQRPSGEGRIESR
jgi:hypothetical protein